MFSSLLFAIVFSSVYYNIMVRTLPLHKTLITLSQGLLWKHTNDFQFSVPNHWHTARGVHLSEGSLVQRFTSPKNWVPVQPVPYTFTEHVAPSYLHANHFVSDSFPNHYFVCNIYFACIDFVTLFRLLFLLKFNHFSNLVCIILRPFSHYILFNFSCTNCFVGN